MTTETEREPGSGDDSFIAYVRKISVRDLTVYDFHRLIDLARRATTLPQAERERIRNEAIEEAASTCLRRTRETGIPECYECETAENLAVRIRALKSPEPQTNQGARDD